MLTTPSASVREPIFKLPPVVLWSVLLLLGIHAGRVFLLSDETDLEWLLALAVVPVRWAVAYGGVQPDDVINALQQGGENKWAQLALARFLLSQEGGKPWTGLTYALLHGSWTHVILNSVWLAAFGTPLARRCGAGRFLLLAAICAFAGALAYVAMHPLQMLPLIGASAAVSGMMASAAWFIFAPATFHVSGRMAEPHERHRESLPGLMANRQVLLFLGVWLVINYFSGAFAQPLGVADASIAWEAHLGGFFAGLLLFPFLDPMHRRGARGA